MSYPPPLRDVRSIRVIAGADTDLVTLACGHEHDRRHRTIAPKRARCSTCAPKRKIVK